MPFYMAGKNVPLPLKVFPKLIPAWFGHLQGLEITDGDNTFLIAQVSIPKILNCLITLCWSCYCPQHTESTTTRALTSGNIQALRFDRLGPTALPGCP